MPVDEKRKVLLYLVPLMMFALAMNGCNSNDNDVEPDYPDAVTDIDGNVYDVVVIGDQVWMAGNLRTTRYQNGDPLVSGLDDQEWMSAQEGAYAIYPHDDVDGLNSDQEMTTAYGKLYNWHAVDDNRGLCPEGWRVPTDHEFTMLAEYVRDNVQPEDIGNVLKSCRQVNSPLGGECDTEAHPRWNENETHYGTDELGYKALPAGNRSPHNGSFETIGHWWTVWTSTQSNADEAEQRWLRSNSGSFFDLDPAPKHAGKSVRCIWAGE